MHTEDTQIELWSEDRVLAKVIGILNDMTADWETEFSVKIGGETLIISDLEFESIDVVQFVVQIEETFGRKTLPFEKLLMIDGRYRSDMTVREVADFLCKYL